VVLGTGSQSNGSVLLPVARAGSSSSHALQRGLEIGVNMEAAVADGASAEQRAAKLAATRDPSIIYPAYYKQPFHAYEAGNLSWESALEVELASRAVHATVMDPANVAVEAEGDLRMRESYHKMGAQLVAEMGGEWGRVTRVVDLGCAVGLSSLAAAAAFPGAQVDGTSLWECWNHTDAAFLVTALMQRVLLERHTVAPLIFGTL
jgi:hypothetical protein